MAICISEIVDDTSPTIYMPWLQVSILFGNGVMASNDIGRPEEELDNLLWTPQSQDNTEQQIYMYSAFYHIFNTLNVNSRANSASGDL